MYDMAPDGISKAMKEAMRGKAENWADRVRSGHAELMRRGISSRPPSLECSYIEAPALRQVFRQIFPEHS